jgi:hypothetical protein
MLVFSFPKKETQKKRASKKESKNNPPCLMKIEPTQYDNRLRVIADKKSAAVLYYPTTASEKLWLPASVKRKNGERKSGFLSI